MVIPPAKTFHLPFKCQQHHCGSEAEREQDPVGPLLLSEPLWEPNLPEPDQERHQLCGGRSILGTIQPAGQ